jgi:AraC family transcriptional regulator
MWISPEPRYATLAETRLVGRKARMSLVRNTTRELWQRFMPDLSRIPNRIGSDLFSIEVYDDLKYFRRFDPNAEFEKWAAAPVSETAEIPEGMEAITLREGTYAVFRYRGSAADVQQAYQYIYGTWIQCEGQKLDHRPHFAIMGADYRVEDPDSEETIWVPVRKS